MLALLMKPRLALSLALVVTFYLPQVLTETAATSEDHHTLEKRNVGVLARTGQLPYQQGKRYMASLARSGNMPVYLEKKLHPSVTSRNQHESQLEPDEKRYVGALLRTGSLPFQFQNKRDSDQDVRDEEELEKLKTLETVLYLESQLNLELLKEKLLDGAVHEEETGDEKRSMASLARAGNMPLRSEEKRSVEALARAGYLPASPKTMAARSDNAEEVETSKRSVATLARNGQLRGFQEAGKRGGIGSLARNNLLPQKKDDNIEELEELIEELIEEEKDKKNIGSVARSSSYGKRNLGALARGGGYARYAKNGDEYQEEKRNLASLVRGREAPMAEGKRYLGSLARAQSVQKKDVDEEKRRAPMALARYWSKPVNMDVFDKRFLPFDDMQSDPNVREIAKRYVAALLRQGRLPVGADEHHEADEEHGDDKRHIGSVRNSAGISKRSIEHQPPDAHGKTAGGRSKREAYLSDEYPMPNVQNGELFDYDDLMEVMTGAAAPEKRFLGRIPQMGRRPKTTPAPTGRRRPTLRDVVY